MIDKAHIGIAAAHNMSARTLDRLFADQPWSVSGLIRHERLDGVRRDLEDPLLRHRSVAVLAARWGFFDAAHFSRVFRQHYGYPPSQARSATAGTRAPLPSGVGSGSARLAGEELPQDTGQDGLLSR